MSAKKIFLVVCVTLIATAARTQTYVIDWSAVTAGGGTLTGGGFSLDASIGDSSAGIESSAQGYTLEGGFVPGGEAVVPPQWILRVTNGPPARYGNAMVYDSARGVTVMYGGGTVVQNVGYVGFGEVWEWNGADWRQRTTYNSSNAWHQDINGYWFPNYGDTPTGRMQHAMAYDTRRGRVVMFGGRGASPGGGDFFFGDTWEWDGLRWELRATNGPFARISHAMAYDAWRGVTVLYGGAPGGADKVWEWDGVSWKGISPTNGPASNYSQDAGSMAYDSFSHEVFFGPASDGFQFYFWFWNGRDWHSPVSGFAPTINSPPNGAMVFDTFRQKFVYFGGQYNRYGGNMTAFLGPGTGPAMWTFLPASSQTSLFSEPDFVNVSNLVAKLNAHTDPVSLFLWNQFPIEAQQALTDSGATPEQLKTVLVTNLNVVVKGNSIFDATRFAAVSLSPETQVLQRLDPPGPDLIRFNRLLLEDAYSLELVRSPSAPSGRMRTATAYDSQRHALVTMGGLYDPFSPGQLAGNETWELLTPDELVINQQPLNQFRQAGDDALFNVSARSRTGAALSYQWFFGTQPLNDAGRVSGSHTATLQIANVTGADAGQYWVRVSAGPGVADSRPAILTLNPKLQIFTLGRAGTLLWGDTVVALEHADNVTGPWLAVPGANNPFDIGTFGPAKFFRLNIRTGP